MGFLLLDRPNANGRHYYPTRNAPLLAIVVHGTAGAEDLDTFSDLSAENVAHYAATTDRDVSWHTGSDADSWVDLLPSSYTAWHATDYNSCTHGHEISKRHMDWRGMPEEWVSKTLRMAALGPDGNSGLRKVALDNGIPLRWATRAELDAQIANYRAGRPWQRVGFITHHEVQPADRTDPGYVYESGRLVDTFPRERFIALLNNLEDDMPSAKEVVDELFARRLYFKIPDPKKPGATIDHSERFDQVVADIYAQTFWGLGRNTAWGPGVAIQLRGLLAAFQQFTPDELDVDALLARVDQTVRAAVAESTIDVDVTVGGHAIDTTKEN